MKFGRTIAAAGLILMLGVSGCTGGKPSKEAVIDAISKQGGPGVAGDMVKKFASCIVDKSYDELSAETLNAIVSGGTPQNATDEEKATLTKASGACLGAGLEGIGDLLKK